MAISPQVFQIIKNETFQAILEEFGKEELRKFKDLFYGSVNKTNMLVTFNERYDEACSFEECIRGLK